MSSKTVDTITAGRAEQAFRDAFDRLKANKPLKLPKGSRISQNNVAKEAGCDPSALRKSRFPALISSIQEWLQEHQASTQSLNQKIVDQRKKNREKQERIDEIALQRDHLSSLLVQADSKILELSKRVAMLEAMLPANVVALPLAGTV